LGCLLQAKDCLKNVNPYNTSQDLTTKRCKQLLILQKLQNEERYRFKGNKKPLSLLSESGFSRLTHYKMRSDSDGNLLKKFKGTAGRGSWKRGCRMIYRPRRSTTTLKGVTYSRSAATKQKPMKMAVALVPSQAKKKR
jgi:hypothetical protein